MDTLPLSWSLEHKPNEDIGIIENKHFKWLATTEVSNLNLYKELKLRTDRNVIVRGCNKEHKEYLENYGFHFSQCGMEAILDTSLDHFEKKSLREIISRGKKHGRIISLNYSPTNKKRLEEFRKKAIHGNFPQLINLFQSEFKPNNILLVFIDRNKNWLGAILLSKNSKVKVHTELLLRSVNAPIGIMESLIEHAFILVKSLGYNQFSLGEVPFIYNGKLFDDFIGSLTAYLGKIFSFAYSYKGLYVFKNKFNPLWKEIYICSNKKIRISHLYFLFTQSHFHKLAVKKFWNKVKRITKNDYDDDQNFISENLDFVKTLT